MDEKVIGQCDRCCQPHNNQTIMSMFNKDILCMRCKAIEKNHPDYDKAAKAELDEVKKGNRNFEGIGLPEDLK